MKKETKTIIICVVSIVAVIVLVAVITFSFAYMKRQVDANSVTEVNLNSCAKISLNDYSSIDLSDSYPMSKNQALKNTPYTFTVTSSCESNVGFNLYLATLNTNTLSANKIRYIITNTDTTTIIKEGILGDLSNVSSSFTNEEINQYKNGIGENLGNIYLLYNEAIPLKGSLTYDLYLYVDEAITGDTSNSETFVGGIAVKSYDV